MSRRCHHGSPRHARAVGRERRPASRQVVADPLTSPPASPGPAQVGEQDDLAAWGDGDAGPDGVAGGDESIERPADAGALEAVLVSPDIVVEQPAAELVVAPPSEPWTRIEPPIAAGMARPAPRESRLAPPGGLPAATPSAAPPGGSEHTTTAPQLRRFIKSRAYVPMHELRRRFGINGSDDDVTAVEVDRQRVYVGLPEREGRLLGELLSAGDIGVELSLDPIAPIVVGVFPIRPIPRS